MSEQWKRAGYGLYEVSDQGRIRNNDGRILAPHTQRNGYQGIRLSLNGTKKGFLVHRLVARAFIPNPDNAPQVNHKDGDKAHNAVVNLEWMTQAQNSAHSATHITKLAKDHNQGTKNGRSKVTEGMVRAIRYEHKTHGYTIYELAPRYGIHPSNIARIVRHVSWPNVSLDGPMEFPETKPKAVVPTVLSEWRRVGFGDYEVSEYGEVKGLKVLVQRDTQSGYKTVKLYWKGESKTIGVHRLVAQAFIPNPEDKAIVNHKDGDRTNNHKANLEWVTHTENMAHMSTTGAAKSGAVKGTDNGRSKLTKEQVLKIRALCKEGVSQRKIAKEFNIHQGAVSKIHLKKTWAHV